MQTPHRPREDAPGRSAQSTHSMEGPVSTLAFPGTLLEHWYLLITKIQWSVPCRPCHCDHECGLEMGRENYRESGLQNYAITAGIAARPIGYGSSSQSYGKVAGGTLLLPPSSCPHFPDLDPFPLMGFYSSDLAGNSPTSSLMATSSRQAKGSLSGGFGHDYIISNNRHVTDYCACITG